MTNWLDDFETEPGTFFAYEETQVEIDDPYDPDGGTTTEYEWVVQGSADVRFEAAGRGFMNESTGDFVRRSPRVFAPVSLLGDYGVERAEALEGEGFARGGTGEEPTHRIVSCHLKQLDMGDPGYLEAELEDISDE